MARADGFETLMIRIETKSKFREAKKKLEEQLGITLSHSQALDLMCNKILLGSI
jgi:hypothetical protein